ncbi:MAG: hypothetical protein HRT57_08215 [Crocinitomicaceae bacterium]|nr:hypothetical protein [Crocinitomicaceae bacterium]
MEEGFSDDSNRGGGDVIVSKCNVISSSGKQLKDISKKAWNSITYTESMGLLTGDPQFISGEIGINDQIDIFNEMALVGDEVVELRFNTPQKKEINFVGKVYNVGVVRPDDKTRLVKLKFCSAEKITADQITINRAYREVLYSDMAKDIFTPLNVIGSKKLYVEPTKNKGSIIVNNKSPLDVLNLIAKVSRSAEYMGANYVLFEQSDGFFKFASIESLIDPSRVSPTISYVIDSPSGEKNDLRKLVGVKKWKVITFPNVVSGVKGGVYGSTLVSHDLMKRKVAYTTFNYDESYNQFKSVNYNQVGSGQGKTSLTNNKTYSERNSGFVKFLPKHFKSFDTEKNYNDEREESELIRNSQLRQINSIRLMIIVPGDSQRRVGEVIKLKVPTAEEKGGKIDEIMSGRYLISKIKHVVGSEPNDYNTAMEIVADSFTNPLPTKA